VISIKEIVEKQFNINELLSSNHLTTLLKEGSVIQDGFNSFILLLGQKKPFKADLNAIGENQILVYQTLYWSYLNPVSANQCDREAENLYYYPQSFRLSREDLCLLTRHILGHQNSQDGHKLKLVSDHFIEFKNQFDWSQSQFQSGRLSKTVPFTFFDYQVDQFNFWLALDFAIHNKDVSGFVYCFWSGKNGYLGKTPEVLASYENKTLTTMALAGTWSNHINYSVVEDVDLKTREEHSIVVQDIVSRLGERAQTSKTYIYNVKYLNHLRTDITIKVESERHFINLVEQLHPTAALGIYPRNLQLAESFSKLELQKERTYFGSPVGFVTKNCARIYVGIRSLCWNLEDSRLSVMCGCGVTAQSELQTEWVEIMTKKNAIFKMFNLKEEAG